MNKKLNLSDFNVELQRSISDTGIKFVHYKKLNAPIALAIASNSGSRYDPKGKEGLAHFLEHMLFEGSEKFKSKKELSLVLDEIGGFYAGSTSVEDICLEFTVATKENLNVVAEVVDQILNRSLFLEKKIDSERNVIRTEIDSKMDSPNVLLVKHIKELVYGESAVVHVPGGSLDSINNIAREDLISHLHHTFPNGLTVTSCGGCDIKDLMDTFVPILPSKVSVVPLPTQLSSFNQKTGFTPRNDLRSVYGKLAFPTCGLDCEDVVALNVLATYIGRGRTSLLMEQLRYDSGLLYGISAGNYRYKDAGIFYIDFNLKKEHLNATLNKIDSALDALNSTGIAEESLTTIKNKVINSTTISMQTVRSWVDFQYFRELLIPENKVNYADYLNALQNITSQDILRVSNKYFKKEYLYSWFVGDIDKLSI